MYGMTKYLKLKLLILLLLLPLSSFGLVEKKVSYKKAVFAGGCFWSMEKPFDKIRGVVRTTSGYIGGHDKNPSYYSVRKGKSGHREAVQVIYDPSKVTYQRLLNVFWMNIDPTDLDGQFVDRGSQYRPEVFTYSKNQNYLAKRSKLALEKSMRFNKPIVVPITKASKFYAAEKNHQDFYKKKPLHYKLYRSGSGRDKYLRKYWKKKIN